MIYLLWHPTWWLACWKGILLDNPYLLDSTSPQSLIWRGFPASRYWFNPSTVHQETSL